MFKTIILCVILAVAGVATAGDVNPFQIKATSIDGQEARKPLKKESHPRKREALDLPPLPGPALPKLGGVSAGTGGPEQQPAKKNLAWRILGRVDGKVSITNSYTGAISLVDDGEVIEGCILDYPSFNCDQEQQANTRAKQNIKKDQKSLVAGRAKLAAEKTTQDKELKALQSERDNALVMVKAISVKADQERIALENEKRRLTEELQKYRAQSVADATTKDRLERAEMAAKKNAEKLAADLEKHKKSLAAANLALESMKREVPPPWFDRAQSRKYIEKTIGEVEVIAKDGQILALCSPVTQAKIMETSLSKYIKDKIIAAGYVYYQVSGLIIKGES